MQTRFAGNNRITVTVWVCLGVLALAAGCASAPRQTVWAPVFQEDECRAALKAGALAMTECGREQVQARLDNRTPDYAKARERLAGALAVLQPVKQSSTKPQYERAALCFETALAGVDRVIAARKAGDEDMEAVGWEMIDQSSGDLLLALEPYASAGAKSPAKAQ